MTSLRSSFWCFNWVGRLVLNSAYVLQRRGKTSLQTWQLCTGSQYLLEVIYFFKKLPSFDTSAQRLRTSLHQIPCCLMSPRKPVLRSTTAGCPRSNRECGLEMQHYFQLRSQAVQYFTQLLDTALYAMWSLSSVACSLVKLTSSFFLMLHTLHEMCCTSKALLYYGILPNQTYFELSLFIFSCFRMCKCFETCPVFQTAGPVLWTNKKLESRRCRNHI